MRTGRDFGRRRVLAATATALGGTLAGCVGSALGGHGGKHTHLDVNLDAPASAYPYPAHGAELPSVTLPDPLSGTSVTTTQFHDRDVVLSFFYSHCQGVCSRVIATLRNMQTKAEQDGKSDRVVFIAITFDPERDTPERLRAYADREHVDLSIGNWHFLRPPTVERAKQVVHGTFGFWFTKQWKTPTSTPGGANATRESTTAQTPTPRPTETPRPSDDVITPRSEGRYGFTHPALVLLANEDGYVEKAYRDGYPVWQDLYDDLTTLWHREG